MQLLSYCMNDSDFPVKVNRMMPGTKGKLIEKFDMM